MRPLLSTFDATISRAIQSLPDGLHGLMYSVSFIGQPLFTIIIILVIAALSTALQQYKLLFASFVAAATFGANSVLKELFHRPRPDTEYAKGMILETYSFPSGHAASSVVVFGLLAYIAFHALPQPLGSIVAALLIVLIVLIGISRVYLGAHYPSDVLAGWLVGSIGLAIIIWIIRPFA